MKHFRIPMLAVVAICCCYGCGSSNRGTDDGVPDVGDHDLVTADLAGDEVDRDVPAGDTTSEDADSAVADSGGDAHGDVAGHDDLVMPDADAVDPECAGVPVLTCGMNLEIDSADPQQAGLMNRWSGYGRSARLQNGPEIVFRFSVKEPATVTVRLSGMTVDLDLFVLESCDSLADGEASATPLDIADFEQITFQARAGAVYYVVVDGYDGASGACGIAAECAAAPLSPFFGSKAECAFRYSDSSISNPAIPDEMNCMNIPCGSDSDCAEAAAAGAGTTCVTGNCVYCWQDDQCPEGKVCRVGRCVLPDSAACPAVPDSCPADRCRIVKTSESSCPVCVCDTVFDDTCEVDGDCQVLSHHSFSACVYGRCAECRNDDDCGDGLVCMTPGMCYSFISGHPSDLYGTWLIGWPGGLNHFSYFRFEPDGTLRRGSYATDGTWADDVYLADCSGAGELPEPMMGTWRPEMTQSGQFIVAVDFNAWCSPAGPVFNRYSVTPPQDASAWWTFKSIDRPESMDLTGFKAVSDVCSADMSECLVPVIM